MQGQDKVNARSGHGKKVGDKFEQGLDMVEKGWDKVRALLRQGQDKV